MPVFSPQYSRSTLMTHMLCELLAQALGQINSVATRLRLGFPASPRQLRTLILTLPSAMPKQEREIFRRRMFEAIAIVWKAMGWHPQDEDFATRKQQEKSVVPVPEIQMEWDEASCGQLVWLYNEAISHFGGQTEAFFASLARTDREPEPGVQPGRALRVASIDIGGGTSNYVLFDAGKVSGSACLNVGGRLLETDGQGRVVHAHQPGQMIVDDVFGPGTDARTLNAAQLVQVARRMAALIVEVIDGTLSPLAQALMQTGLLPTGVKPEVITLSGGVGECYRNQPADPFCFSDIGPLLATALHEHPRLREMNVQFPAQTVRATVIGAGAHTLSLSGSTIWLEGVALPLRNLPVAIPVDEADLVAAWQQALMQLDLDPQTDAYVLALPASLPVRYAALLTVIDALLAFVARYPNPHPLLVVAEQDFGKALGMLLRPQLQQHPLAVIDEVVVRAGDYIDIGTPLFGGSVVPVTVKSLAFPS